MARGVRSLLDVSVSRPTLALSRFARNFASFHIHRRASKTAKDFALSRFSFRPSPKRVFFFPFSALTNCHFAFPPPPGPFLSLTHSTHPPPNLQSRPLLSWLSLGTATGARALSRYRPPGSYSLSLSRLSPFYADDRSLFQFLLHLLNLTTILQHFQFRAPLAWLGGDLVVRTYIYGAERPNGPGESFSPY